MSSYEFVYAKSETEQHTARAPRRLRLLALGLISIGSLLWAWWAVTAAGLIEPLFLPSPQTVLARGWKLITEGYLDASLWQHLGASLGRIGLALFFAVLTAIPLGIAIGRNRVVRGLVDPLIEFYRPIPPLAYLPLIVIWCGIGELSKVLLIYLAIFAPIVIATATGVRSVDPAKLRAAQALGATPGQLIRHVVLPSALPDILTGVRIGLGVGWSTLVAAELIAAQRGLGFMVQSAAQFLVTDVVILGILLIAVIAFALELGLRALQRKLVPWHGQAH
ncbi:taurine ABC transporter permease TauC [Pseudomonas sp. Gutcm_11s]|uniref:taurine ABC transporter permease TauC n=1 Tax=Pseudomonas sp. Gutcm_11s TaxID=3026088 RepID=UPI003FD266EC